MLLYCTVYLGDLIYCIALYSHSKNKTGVIHPCGQSQALLVNFSCHLFFLAIFNEFNFRMDLGL